MAHPDHRSKIETIDPKALTEMAQDFYPGHAGIEFTKSEPDKIQAKLTIEKQLMNPMGSLHGGTVVGLADTACAVGCWWHLIAQGAKGFTTLELKTNFLSSCSEGEVYCEAFPVHIGKRTHVWDATVSSEKTGKIMAEFRCTQLIIW